MTLLKSRRFTSKLAIGLLLGSTLLSASIAHSREDCISTTSVCADYTKDGPQACKNKAQFGNSDVSSTSGWYPCYWDDSSSCKASKNNNARCSTYQCSMNTCSTYTNMQSCVTSLFISAADDTDGQGCDWIYPTSKDQAAGKCIALMKPLITCGTKTPIYSP